MPTDEAAFLATIVAAPDDDTPRLVFADWLDERGTDDDRARAEFIRAQCRAATLKPGTKARRELEKRAKELLAANREHWEGPLKRAPAARKWGFRRGFVEHVEMSARDFPRAAKTLFDLAPTVTSARFPDASNEVRELLKLSHLKRLARVDLSKMCSCGGCAIQGEIVALFRSKNAANIRELNISGNRLDAVTFREIQGGCALTNLTHLDLSNNPLGPGGVALVAAIPALESLESLDLSNTGPQIPGLSLFLDGQFPNLKRLALRDNNIGVAAVRILMKSRLVNRLRELDLSHNRIGESGTSALLENAGFDSLEQLDLRHNDIAWTIAVRHRFGKRVKV